MRSTALTRPARESHICLVARPNSTIEHLQSIAQQATREKLEVCWLDLGHEPGIAEVIRSYDHFGGTPVRVDTPRALKRHFKKHQPVGVWIQTPYPEHYPDWFWSTVEPWPLCFAQYSIQLMTWEHGLYRLSTYDQCRWILVESSSLRNGYLANKIPPDRVLLAGNPTLYELRHSDAAQGETSPNDLLWAPHWSQDWFGQRGFSRWREVAPVLLAWARTHPEKSVAVRPHPLLHDFVDAAAEDDAGAAAYRDLLALANTRLSEASLADDVRRSAALLSDGLSILAYFATTGKPLGLVHDADSPQFCELGYAILGCSDVLSTPEAVEAWLNALDDARLNTKRAYVADQLLPDFPESPIAMWNRRRIAAGGN
jgi:hypothetical protein